MGLRSASRTAKAIGAITWAADGVFRVTGKVFRAGYNAVRNKPLYNVDIAIKGEITDRKVKINESEVKQILNSIHQINGVTLVIESSRTIHDN